jgi:ABC-2 type transport system ATP-binding protein
MSRPVCDSEFVIDVQGVSKRFQDVQAVSGVSLRIRRGEYVALLGPNGAGKTTLVEMIEGLQRPDTGAISVLGRPWQGNERDLRRSIGLSLQETRFIDKLTTEEILGLFAGFYGLGRDRVEEVLALIGLTDKRRSYTVNLSGGQRQKLALGVAILNRPEILILDEPTIGLDPNARREIWKLLEGFKERCATLILTTHYMEEAQSLCERILIMHQGRFLAEGTFAELLARHGNGEVIEFTLNGSAPAPEWTDLPGLLEKSWDPQARRGRLLVDSKTAALPPFLAALQRAGLELTSLEFRALSLDDLFTSLTGRHLDD